LVAHVEACPRCQLALESLTAFESTGCAAPASQHCAGKKALEEGELQRLWRLLCPAKPVRGTRSALAPADSPGIPLHRSRISPHFGAD
jgi:hypothetical protein